MLKNIILAVALLLPTTAQAFVSGNPHMDDKRYFDAKFERIEKLMMYHQSAMSQHISSVSEAGKLLRKDFDAHKDDTESAHGAKTASRVMSNTVGWLGLAAAIALAIIEFKK